MKNRCTSYRCCSVQFLRVADRIVALRTVTFRTLTALIVATTLSACASIPVISKQKSLTIDSETVIGEFGYWRRDCSNRHFDIYIDQYPQGGDLRFEVGSLTIPEDPETGTAGSCVGKEIQSKKVIYVARPGFVGQDSVSYTVKSSFFLGSKIYAVNLSVE